MAAVGSALHAVIAAELVNPGGRQAVGRASAILHSYGADGHLAAADAVAAARRLHGTLERRFQPRRVLVEYPVTEARDDGRVVRGFIDLLLETDDGWVIIDHKSSPRPRSEWPAEIAEYSGQLATYAGAVARAAGPVAGTWIHFPVSGALVEVRLPG